MRPWKDLAAEASRWVLLASLLFGALLLLVPVAGDGGTYQCHVPPVWRLVHPAAQQPAPFRQGIFDEAYQCNQDARWRGGEAGAVVTLGALPFIAFRRRRRSGRLATTNAVTQ
jgi:hypothetical protein